MSDYIALLDPSLEDNDGSISPNLGDSIIYRDVIKIINRIFPLEVKRISLHANITSQQQKLIRNAHISFVGGSNVLTSNIIDADYTRMLPGKNLFKLFQPKFSNIVLMGTGWCEYQPRPGLITTHYYHKILNKKFSHSVRDHYSEKKLKQAFIPNVINTGCPTMWNLKNHSNIFEPLYNKIIFTLTDYRQNMHSDNEFIHLLLKTEQQDLFFFPQGKKDIEYIQSLDSYKKNSGKIHLLPHDLNHFYDLIDSTRFNYIGTRLHAGIACMQRNAPSIIIGTDNRALEMGKDFGLPVIARRNRSDVINWINHLYETPSLNIPYKEISMWLNQFQ